MSWPWMVAYAFLGVAVGLPLAALGLLVGVPALALWAGRSRNRDCERRGWEKIGRF